MPKTSSSQLKKQIRLLKDRAQLEKIGSRMVADSIHRALVERLGLRDDDVALVLKKGDPVPESMRREPEIAIDAKGLAAADWCKAWCKGGDWGGNCWGKCQADLPWEGGFHWKSELSRPTQDRLIGLLLEENFAPDEIELLKGAGIL
jgi:hypothetical protein